MSLDPPNYTEAVKAHQLARAKIDEVLMLESPQLQHPFFNGPRKPLLVSLYGQKERHIYMQNVILSKQQKALEESKASPYLASARERKTEMALLDAHRQEKQRIDKVYREQNELYDSLNENLTQEGDTKVSVEETGVHWSSSTGKKKPKSYEETIEELKNTQKHFKFITDQYASAIMQMKTELMTIEQEELSPRTDSIPPTDDITTSITDSSAPESLEFHSLEKPPPFELPENFLQRLTDNV